MALVITGALALATPAAATSLKFPRIGYENRLRDDNVTITTTTAEVDAEGASVINGLTYDFWQPTTVPATITFIFTEAVSADYCGVAGHTLTETGNQIELEFLDQSSPAQWVSLGSVLPGNETGNKTIMFLFDEVTSSGFRLTVSGGTGLVFPVLAAVSVGLVLKTERGIYGGHTPITLSKVSTMRPQISEGGQFLGRSITREGAATTIALKNLTASFVRNDFQPFMESARTFAFFFAWRPTVEFEDEVAFCWTDKDIRVTNNGQANLMDTSFSVTGLVE